MFSVPGIQCGLLSPSESCPFDLTLRASTGIAQVTARGGYAAPEAWYGEKVGGKHKTQVQR